MRPKIELKCWPTLPRPWSQALPFCHTLTVTGDGWQHTMMWSADVPATSKTEVMKQTWIQQALARKQAQAKNERRLRKHYQRQQEAA